MEPQIVKRALMIAALTVQLALAETTQPPPVLPITPVQPVIEKKVVWEGDWRESGHAKLIFQGTEDTSAVETIRLKTRVTGETWFADVEYEGLDHLGFLAFKAQKELFLSTRGFAEWKVEEGNQEVAAGLETALFGRDKLRLRRASSLTEEVAPTTQMDYEVPLPFHAKIGISGLQQGERNELTGQIRQNCGEGWEWGAGVKTELLHGKQIMPPEIQGSLRWTW
ncbi:MAG: hypothetical protein WC314_02000 [Vulcanimicrobiota bacterium]